MSHDQLSIDIKNEPDAGALVFKLRGSLDIGTSPSVRAALLEAAQQGNHDVIVDLSQLEFLDSTGLGALIGAHRRAMENGGSLRLVVNDGPIARLLNITGLMRAFSAYASVDSALKHQDRLAASL